MSERAKGSTSNSLFFRLTDATTGAAKSGITVTTLRLQYTRPGAAASTATSLTLLAAQTTGFTAFGAIEVDATNSKGVYRVDCPDTAFASGADEVTLSVSGSGIETSTRLIDLTSVNSRNGVNFGLSALPAFAPGADGGLWILGSNASAAGTTLSSITGDALSIVAQSGTANGLFIRGHGGGDGINVGGGGSSGNGARFLAGSGGADILGSITGNIIGTLATLTTYTGNTPQTGDAFAQLGAAGAGLTALGDTSGTTTLLTRLSSARAGYLDNLSAGAVALASQIPANFTTACFVSAGVFSTAALANAPTGGSAPSAAAIRAEIDANSTQLTTIVGRIVAPIGASISADLQTRSTFAGGAVASVTAGVTVTTNNDKSGYGLAATGLDSIPVTAHTGPATTFPQMMVQAWRRFFKPATRSTTQLKTLSDDGLSTLTTQPITDDGGGNETQGAAV